MAGRDRDDMEVLILESDEIWQSLRRALGSFIRHRVGNLEDAEDILQEVLDSNMASPEDEPDADAGRRLAGCLAAMIDELPAPYREAITLVEQDGMTQREYAARCGLSVSGAKARVQRARKKLKANSSAVVASNLTGWETSLTTSISMTCSNTARGSILPFRRRR